MNKVGVLEVLKNMAERAHRERNFPVAEALACALEDVGKCHACHGTKEVEVPAATGPHRKKRDTGGRVKILIVCPACRGSGKYLDFTCESCGKKTKVEPTQKLSMTHCAPCTERLVRKGVL